MKHIKNLFISLFFVFLTAHLLFIYAGWEYSRLISKILLVPLLMAYLRSSANKKNEKSAIILPLWAFFFSFLGDFFLSMTGTGFFLAGMFSFMLTHLINSYCFLRMQQLQKGSTKPIFLALLGFLAATFLVYRLIAPSLGGFKVPILIYMGLIGIMGMLATNLCTNKLNKHIAFRYFIPGAAFFLLSDSLLAINMFHFKQPEYWEIPVMLTYGLAQFLLVLGYAKWQSNKA